MSWAEIKKAINSDLSLPLNKLITQGVYGLKTTRGYGNINASSDYKTLLNVTGKGYLANMLFYGTTSNNTYSKTLTLKMIIDDKNVLYLEFPQIPTITSSRYSTLNITAGIVNLKSGVINDTLFRPFADYDNASETSYGDLKLNNIQLANLGARTGRQFLKLSSDLQIIPAINFKGGEYYLSTVVLMNELIRFEKNIKIQVLGDGLAPIGSSEYLATYILDE